MEIEQRQQNEEVNTEWNFQNLKKTLQLNIHNYLIIIFQIVSIIFYSLFTKYGVEAVGETGSDTSSNTINTYYPMFQDVHVMIFIGFGFLMTFLKKYSFSGVGLNFLIAAITIQYSILINGFFHCLFKNHWEMLTLDITSLITGDFAAGAVLITFGALLGKISAEQLLILVPLELIFYSINESLGVEVFEAVDMGGSMYVHTFGAYFGMAVSYMIVNKDKLARADFRTTKTTELFAMIGTIFLWLYWPSFNGVLAVGNSQHRVVINTVLSLTNSCISAFFMSRLLRPHNKFSMEDILNATLAGGVAVGSSADLVIGPYASLIIGAIAGSLSVIGYVHIQPYLERKFNIHDTCGVHNLHGLPGIIGGISGFISASVVSDSVYGDSITDVFPGRDGRTAAEQGAFQLLTLIVTLVMSIGGGILTGLILNKFRPEKEREYVDDDEDWGEEP